MLNDILTIYGKQGLFKLLTRGRGALIVENIDESKKRFPIQSTDKVVSLGDISIFTEGGEIPLRQVFQAMEKKIGKDIQPEENINKGSNDELVKFFAGIIPDFDRERVYPSHIWKIATWYGLLVRYGENDFSESETEQKADVSGE